MSEKEIRTGIVVDGIEALRSEHQRAVNLLRKCGFPGIDKDPRFDFGTHIGTHKVIFNDAGVSLKTKVIDPNTRDTIGFLRQRDVWKVKIGESVTVAVEDRTVDIPGRANYPVVSLK